MVTSLKREEFTSLKYTFKTADNTTRTEIISVSGQNIHKFLKVKGLMIGFCFKFQIYVHSTNAGWISSIEKTACTSKFFPCLI